MGKRQMNCHRSINVHLGRLYRIKLIIEAHILSEHGIIMENLAGSDVGPWCASDAAIKRGKNWSARLVYTKAVVSSYYSATVPRESLRKGLKIQRLVALPPPWRPSCWAGPLWCP